MIAIKLMPEFMCDPLWQDLGTGSAPINPFNLPISRPLAQAISDWGENFQATYDEGYPPDSSFNSPEEEDQFYKKGLALANQLQIELGEEYQVRTRFPGWSSK